MRYVSATETKQRFAAVLDAALSQPVTIRRRKRDVAVLLVRDLLVLDPFLDIRILTPAAYVDET